MPAFEASTRAITNFSDLEQAIDEAEKSLAVPAFWRGHGDAEWALRAHVFRKPPDYQEASMLWRFLTRGSARMQSPPPITDRLSWIQLAQHYGLPTRFLDWTYNGFRSTVLRGVRHREGGDRRLHLGSGSPCLKPKIRRIAWALGADGVPSQLVGGSGLRRSPSNLLRARAAECDAACV
jgi:hypothetical protein